MAVGGQVTGFGVDVNGAPAASGAGVGGRVSISVGPATTIAAIGTGSVGILAQVEGKVGTSGLGTIAIDIDETAAVIGGTLNPKVLNDSDAAAIRLIGGNANRIRNEGSMVATDISSFYAIRATGETKTSVVNTG